MLKKRTGLWREARLEVKLLKPPQGRSAFGSSDVEKVHAAVARSTFGSQSPTSTTCSDQLLEVEISKKSMPLWCEAHLQVKMVKHRMFGPVLDFKRRFVWQAQWTLHLVKSEPSVWALWQFQK